MLVELKVVEQRYRAVLDVLDGMSVTDVASRNGVTRQTVHAWLRRYADGGMAALADKSSKPGTCPHQMPPAFEARVVELRRIHPGWGPRSIRTRLANRTSPRRRAVLRSIAPWCVTACSSRPNANGASQGRLTGHVRHDAGIGTGAMELPGPMSVQPFWKGRFSNR